MGLELPRSQPTEASVESRVSYLIEIDRFGEVPSGLGYPSYGDELLISMPARNIHFQGKADFPCPVGWTVEQAVMQIRSMYVVIGGGILRNGEATLPNDTITVDGDYVFVNFVPQQRKILLFDINF